MRRTCVVSQASYCMRLIFSHVIGLSLLPHTTTLPFVQQMRLASHGLVSPDEQSAAVINVRLALPVGRYSLVRGVGMQRIAYQNHQLPTRHDAFAAGRPLLPWAVSHQTAMIDRRLLTQSSPQSTCFGNPAERIKFPQIRYRQPGNEILLSERGLTNGQCAQITTCGQ